MRPCSGPDSWLQGARCWGCPGQEECRPPGRGEWGAGRSSCVWGGGPPQPSPISSRGSGGLLGLLRVPSAKERQEAGRPPPPGPTTQEPPPGGLGSIIHMFGKFSAIITSHMVSVLFFLSFPSGNPFKHIVHLFTTSFMSHTLFLYFSSSSFPMFHSV